MTGELTAPRSLLPDTTRASCKAICGRVDVRLSTTSFLLVASAYTYLGTLQRQLDSVEVVEP